MNTLIHIIESIQVLLIMQGFSVSTRFYIDAHHRIRTYKAK